MDQQKKWIYIILSLAFVFFASAASLYFMSARHIPSQSPQSLSANAGGSLSPTTGGTTTPTGGTLTAGQPTTGATVLAISPTPTTNLCLVLNNCSTPSGGVTPPPGPTPPGHTPTPTPTPTPCTLSAPSAGTENFSGEAGSSSASQTFTIGVTGAACSGNVTITPTANTTGGGSWLTFSPASASVASGGTATFTASVTTTGLAAGTYNGLLSLAAVDGANTIAGSPQTIGVGLHILAPPALAVTPATLTFTQATGSSTQSIKITNTGGSPLTWTAALASGAPAYVTISAGASGTLNAGATRAVRITVNTTTLTGGMTVTTGVTISATDPATGAAVTGSPANVAISITPPPPNMQLSATTLNFTVASGSSSSQNITLTNTGGNTLTWTVGTPSQPWLAVSPTSGSNAAGVPTALVFTVNATGLLPSPTPYTATVTITATNGQSMTVTVNLTVI